MVVVCKKLSVRYDEQFDTIYNKNKQIRMSHDIKYQHIINLNFLRPLHTIEWYQAPKMKIE